MGWTAERFGRFDREIGCYWNRRREAHKAERIGKKYQWIAYHEFLARVSDNFEFRGESWSDSPEKYEGPWLIGHGRNIDPSCLLKRTQRQEWGPHILTWWFLSSYDAWDSPDDHVAWLKSSDDLPTIEPLIEVTNPQDGWDNRIPKEVMVSAVEYMWEGNNYDCSLDDTIRIYLPSKWLVNHVGLRWCGIEGHMFDGKSNLIAFDPSVKSGGPGALLMNRDALLRFLNENGYDVLWTLLGEKRILGGKMEPDEWNGSLEVNGAFRIRTGRVEGSISPRFVSRKEMARSMAVEDSDVDLLVVMETDENPLHTACRISASIDHPFPLDILVIKPSDLAIASEERNIFDTEVMTKGVTLHEAQDHRSARSA